SLSLVQAQKQMAPAHRPITTPCHGNTNPEAGVMVPSPATAPEIMPSTDGLPRCHHSRTIQVTAPVQAARWVATMAKAAPEFAPSAEPPLKPNQPTQSSPAPITAIDKSYGARFSVP